MVSGRRKWNVCVVGAGIGAEHCAGYMKCSGDYNIYCICDVDKGRASSLARVYDAKVVGDFNVILADSPVDIVDICLPPHLHLKFCLAAIAAGKVVICEKPLVGSLAEIDELIEKSTAVEGKLFPVFQYRYGHGTAQLKALIEAGLAGDCFAGTLETHWNRQSDYYAVPWRGTWAGEQGGAILGHAIHIHDLLQSALGPIAHVFALTSTRVNPIEVEDCAALAIEMESGALITSSVTLGAADNSSRLRLMFEGFTVESDHAPYSPAVNPWRFQARQPILQEQIDTVLKAVLPPKTGYAGLFEAIAEALSGNGGREVTLIDARRSLEFVTAVYASASSRRAVELPLSPTHPMYRSWLPT